MSEYWNRLMGRYYAWRDPDAKRRYGVFRVLSLLFDFLALYCMLVVFAGVWFGYYANPALWLAVGGGVFTKLWAMDCYATAMWLRQYYTVVS